MEAIERTNISNDWITLIFLFCLILIFLKKTYKPKLLLGYFISFFLQRFIKNRSEEPISVFPIFKILSFIFSVTIVSLTITFYTKTKYFLYIFIGVILFVTLKLFVTLLISHLFMIRKSIRYFIFTKLGYLYSICLWAFPILILHHYYFKNIYFLSFFIILLLLGRSFFILKNNEKTILANLFYFILYFCTLELAPLLIIYKIIST
ncbi:MAG: DUF4271 domain-containing protein [Tenacibaculum sp.]|nr:DUF4271 domain-containing protein [Tenacibaculum sp.]